MNYLRIRCGPYLLLLPAEGILEVLGDEETRDRRGDTRDHALWRGQPVRKVSLRQLFGAGAGEEQVRIVHEGDGEPLIYLADAVLGLSQLEEQDFLSLPPLTEPCSSWFDRVCPVAVGHALLLRCRLPLAEQTSHDQTADC